MQRRPHIEGEVTFIPTEAGGRRNPVSSGYRPQFYYDGLDWDAIQEYPDVEHVNPGDTARVIFSFLKPVAHRGTVTPGMMFLIGEGSRTVGYGKVTHILELEHSASDTIPQG